MEGVDRRRFAHAEGLKASPAAPQLNSNFAIVLARVPLKRAENPKFVLSIEPTKRVHKHFERAGGK